MFGLNDTIQGSLIIICLFIIVCAVFQSKSVNPHIERINEQNKDNYRIPDIPTASYYSLIICAVLLVIALVLPIHKNITSSQQEKYDNLEEKYYEMEDTYSETINKCEDPLAVLYCYFEDESITFDEARDAFNIIDEQLSQFY